MSGENRIRGLAFQALVALAAIALALIAAESYARHRYPALSLDSMRQQRPEELFMGFDPQLGWANIPGRQVRFKRADFDTRVTINADGFRGPRVPLERTPGRSRILFLGDSYAFGHGVEEDETAASVLSRFLPGAEIVNLGVTGYSTDQELLLFRERGMKWQPDIVVLLLCTNDLLDNGKTTAWGLYSKPRFLLSGDSLRLEARTLTPRAPFGMRLRRELNRRFVLYELLSWKWASFTARRSHGSTSNQSPGRSGENSDNPSAAAVSRAHALTRRLLSEIAAECAAARAHFLLVVIPPFPATDVVARLPLASKGGALLDLAPVFARYQSAYPDSALGFVHDTHWNPRGQRLVAQAINDVLLRQGWLPADSAASRGMKP